jgi:hypothetical protein
MTPKELKNDKEYKFPGRKIVWTIVNNSLFLEVELDWVKYIEGGLVLPPEKIGRCTNWHFKLSEDAISSTFVCSWDIRRVKDNLKLIDSINENIMPFALIEEIHQ